MYTVEEAEIELKKPAKAGYAFNGWYLENGFENRVYLIAEGSTGELTLYAKWTLVEYNINYNTSGGNNSLLNQSGYNTEQTPITLYNATNNGYTFRGWYIDSGFKNQVTIIQKGTIGNITLYSKWQIVNYNINYNLDNGTNSVLNPVKYTVEDAKIVLEDPVKAGYLFEGWYIDSGFISEITTISRGTIGNIRLFSKWQIINYDIYYNLDGGTNSESNPLTYTVADDTINLISPIKTGYTFSGWYDGPELSDANHITEIVAGKTGAANLYASWRANEHEATFDSQGGSSVKSIKVRYNDKILKPVDPTRANYTFNAWYKEDSYTTLWDFGIDKISRDITLYANWNPIMVMEVELNEHNRTMTIGSEYRLTATVNPSDALIKTVTWVSANNNVATVDQSGKVKAVGIGNVQITSNSQGKSDSCNFLVIAENETTTTSEPTAVPTATPAPSNTTPVSSQEPVTSSAVPMVTITPSIVRQDEESGIYSIEIDADILPFGTKIIQTPSGAKFNLNGNDKFEVTVSVDDLNGESSFELILIGEKDIPLSAVNVDIQQATKTIDNADNQGVSGRVWTIIKWILISLAGSGLIVIIGYSIISKKKK